MLCHVNWGHYWRHTVTLHTCLHHITFPPPPIPSCDVIYEQLAHIFTWKPFFFFLKTRFWPITRVGNRPHWGTNRHICQRTFRGTGRKGVPLWLWLSIGGWCEGNVHTGATPPWLKEDEEEKEALVIGPSLDAFLLHSKVDLVIPQSVRLSFH